MQLPYTPIIGDLCDGDNRYCATGYLLRKLSKDVDLSISKNPVYVIFSAGCRTLGNKFANNLMSIVRLNDSGLFIEAFKELPNILRVYGQELSDMGWDVDGALADIEAKVDEKACIGSCQV